MEPTNKLEISIKIRGAVDTLYKVFEVYPLNVDLDGCPCCVTEDEIKVLCSKNLKELSVDELQGFATDVLITWGGVSDFKHYLPRILELEIYKKYGFHFFSHKLDYANFEEWPVQEIEAIRIYLYNYTLYLILEEEYSDAIDLIQECKKFFSQQGELKDNFEKSFSSFFSSFLENPESNYEIGNYIQAACKLFSTSEIEQNYIGKWAENEKGILAFAYFINDMRNYELLNKDTQEKIYRMRDLLETYWYTSTHKDQTILQNVENAIITIEALLPK